MRLGLANYPPMRFLLFAGLLALAGSLSGQTADPVNDPIFGNWTIKPILGFQGWSTYTAGFEEYDADANDYFPVDNRLNFMLRRTRFGANAKVGERLFVKFLGAADFVGSDQRAATIGGVNNGGFPVLQVWDIYAQYKLTPDSEGLYVIGGYFRPPVGRETISGAFGVSSFEKGFNQWYLRQHLTGTGPGGTGGVYLGGLRPLGEKVFIDYRAGVWNAANNGISQGATYSPLVTSRVSFAFGDPERVTWAHGLPAANSFGKRKTVAVAISAANEGPTTAAPGGIGLLGVDFLVDRGHFHLEGEYQLLTRDAAEEQNLPTLSSATYMLRTGFNIRVKGDAEGAARYLEPTLMVYGFDGATTLADYATVVATNYFGAEEMVIDAGVNYHVKPGKVRVGLHYTAFSGDRGALPADGRLAWNFSQAGVGGIRRGGYGGVEVIVNY